MKSAVAVGGSAQIWTYVYALDELATNLARRAREPSDDVELARQLLRSRSPATCGYAAVNSVESACSPKMPGEPMRVQPSRARRPTSGDD